MDLKIDYFYSLSPREFYNIVQGYSKRKENTVKLSWEQTRLVAFYAAFQMETKDKKITPQKFIPLPWDEKENLSIEAKKPTRTREEMKAMFKNIDKHPS